MRLQFVEARGPADFDRAFSDMTRARVGALTVRPAPMFIHDLNARGVPAPVPRRTGGPRVWAPSTIYAMLTRPLYRGQVIWNRSKKRNAWGQKHQVPRTEQDWVQFDAPDLRIVPESLREAVQERLATSRHCYLRTTRGHLWGRPGNGIESRYLPGSLIVHSRPSGSTRKAVYTCSYHHLRGTTVCRNGRLLPMEAVNHVVLASIEAEVLNHTVVTRTVEKLIEQLKPTADTLVPWRTALRAELVTVEQELARLTTAVAQGGDLSTLVEGIQARDQRRRSLQQELARLEGLTTPSTFDPREVEREATVRLVDYQGLLTRHIPQARQILKKILVGRLVFQPRDDGRYEFSGQASLGRILSGKALTKAGVSPTGFERLCTLDFRRILHAQRTA